MPVLSARGGSRDGLRRATASMILTGLSVSVSRENKEPTVTDAPPPSTVESTLNPQRWKAMPIIALAVSIIIMDATVVNVVLPVPVSYTHLRAHETDSYLVCRLLL